MTKNLKQMSVDELIKKILIGERNFSKIRLPEGADLSGHEGFNEVQVYLRKQNLRTAPIILNDSELMQLKAGGLYMPFVMANNAELRGAYFTNATLGEAQFIGAYCRGANFERADLQRVKFVRAELNSANLQRTNLYRTDFFGANLESAYLKDADFWGANLIEMSLKDVKDLQTVRNLEYAILKKITVTPIARAVIETLLAKTDEKRFILSR